MEAMVRLNLFSDELNVFIDMSPKLSFNWMSSLKFHNELSQQMLVSMALLNRN